jgi:hypothetical protein
MKYHKGYLIEKFENNDEILFLIRKKKGKKIVSQTIDAREIIDGEQAYPFGGFVFCAKCAGKETITK